MHSEEILIKFDLSNSEKKLTRHYCIEVKCACRWNYCECSVGISTWPNNGGSQILHSSSIGERIVVRPGIELGKALYLTSHSVWYCN